MVRVKYRYFLTTLRYHDTSPDLDLTPHVLKSALYHAIEDYYGEIGLGHVQGRIKIVYLAVLTGTALIRAPADYEKQVRVSLSNVLVLRRRQCTCHVIHVGGTVRSCQKQLVSYNTNLLHRQMLECQGIEREEIRRVLERTLQEIRELCVS